MLASQSSKKLDKHHQIIDYISIYMKQISLNFSYLINHILYIQIIRNHMIHGHKKSKKEKSEQQAKDQQQLSLKINSKLAEFFSLQRNDVPMHQVSKLLEFISLLMQLCTDIPTIFNFRRQLILLSIQDKPPSEIAQILKNQIKLTTKLIQGDTKSYTIWSYRQWVVKQFFVINAQVIKAEKDLIKLLLTKDEKNFHVWNYRNWLNSLQSDLQQDLTFTQEKIKTNPFNFSPYHFRTKFLSQKYKQSLQKQIFLQQRKEIITFGMPKKILDDQFEGIKTAIFLNPNQEAPWLYYNWLLNKLIPAFVIKKEQKQTETKIYFNMKVGDFSSLVSGENISLKSNSNNSYSQQWEVNSGKTEIRSNLEIQSAVQVRLETTSRLFLGDFANNQWLKETFGSILERQLQFLGEVIQSQQTPCRFAYLQKASICKLILQLGTSQSEFTEITKKGYESIKAIQEQAKAQKYTLKQLSYWKRLQEGQLTVIQSSLKSLWN